MHNIAIFKAKDVIRAINLKGVKTALDLGGGPGTYAIEMAKKGVSVTLFDSPETVKIARELINRSGVKGIKFIEGNFLSDDLGKGYDLIFISQVLHAYSGDDNIRILEKCMKSLNSGGRISLHEFYIDKSRTYPVQSALFSINMLVNTEGGRCYSPSEIKKWLSDLEFVSIKEKLLDDSVLITADRYSLPSVLP